VVSTVDRASRGLGVAGLADVQLEPAPGQVVFAAPAGIGVVRRDDPASARREPSVSASRSLITSFPDRSAVIRVCWARIRRRTSTAGRCRSTRGLDLWYTARSSVCPSRATSSAGSGQGSGCIDTRGRSSRQHRTGNTHHRAPNTQPPQPGPRSPGQRLLHKFASGVKAEPKTLRYRIFQTPARLVRARRYRWLCLPRTWPWATDLATDLATAIETIRRMPMPAT
jgi:hypothetical protein